MHIYELDLNLTVTTAKDVLCVTAPPSPSDPHLPRGFTMRVLRAALDPAATTTEVLPIQLFRSNHVALGNPTFAVSGNFDVASTVATSYTNGARGLSLAAGTVFDTGTSATIAANQWAIALLSISATAVPTVTWATAAGAGYASEALAIAALPATPANHTAFGYMTVKTASAQTFTAGTDALKTGTGGNPASETNFVAAIGTPATPGPRSGSPTFAAMGGTAQTAMVMNTPVTASLYRQGVSLIEGFEWQQNDEDLIDLQPGESIVLRIDAAPGGSTDITASLTLGLW